MANVGLSYDTMLAADVVLEVLGPFELTSALVRFRLKLSSLLDLLFLLDAAAVVVDDDDEVTAFDCRSALLLLLLFNLIESC